MAKISTNRHATIESSEEDWKKIDEVYVMIDRISDQLSDIGLELDSPEVKFKGFGEGTQSVSICIMFIVLLTNCIARSQVYIDFKEVVLCTTSLF